ncbi:MAG: hypothetical protein DMD78_00870 [Candidatus Rokuibacteriota bacterium]|nr:MAG: hypothetical protein DMD78_00870 [Candidatus Rokubacteria bacterium]
MRRALGLLVLATSILAAANVVRAGEIKPHMAGWENVLALEYGPAEYRGKPVVEGTVTNISPYDLVGIRLLVDTLDSAGQITAQKVAWVPGDLRGGGQLYFSVPTTPAPAYRVRVFTYDRVEAIGGDHR